MRGERWLLRLGEYLVGRACQQLPPDIREERYREWAAELPAILHDPEIRGAPRRASRMLSYAADTLRGAALVPGRAQGRLDSLTAAVDLLFLFAGLVMVVVAAWTIVQAPGEWQSYPLLAWGLLFVAYRIRKLVHPTGRVTALLGLSAPLALAGAFLWNSAQAPGDWANYFLAVFFLLPLLVRLPLAWWLNRLQARTGGRHAAPSDPWWTYTF